MNARKLTLACTLVGALWALASPGQASIVSPGLGDFNGDHLVNHEDIDRLAEAAHAWSLDPDDSGYDFDEFDLNNDDKVTFAVGPNVLNPVGPESFFSDSDVLIRDILATQYGDANLDGSVALNDLITLALHFGQGGDFGWKDGNFNGSQGNPRVSLGDLIALALNWGFVDDSGSVVRVFNDGQGAIEVNPEPVSLQVWLAGALCVYCFKQRRAKRVGS
jgi:hypothetical protein